MSDWVDVIKKDELIPGQHVVVDVDNVAIAVFNIDDEFRAIEDVCTHDGAELASGELEGEVIVCPRHGAKFCLISGAVLAPPAYEPVAVFPIRIRGDMIQVRDDRWDD